MNKNTSPQQQAVARYFFLKTKENKIRELIVVLTSNSQTVQVPMREEDLELQSFYERGMTPQEVATAENNQMWKIFNTWNALISDHQKMGVNQELLNELIHYRNQFALQEEALA
ncbi:hypothetical protein I2I11_03185 [Pontibacter sp. 172403-2]|uniref:hypothetical protein n=1 Tax=Pontibacter rufus TaxID=2791028 RepID=UPI0018AFFD37|nr:hypothetical protein [Pontibacter sp. 172403-2]MBF9252286.1 hypothetical protein [Pontibacter sp. 172403-2]